MYSRHNDFPTNYHPDEPRKAEQILGHSRYNFNHPLLLLNTARLLSHLAGTIDSEAGICITGRWVAAVFASGAVLLLMVMAHVVSGRIVAVAGGLSAACCPMLLTHAHYLKEDTALMFGLALGLLSIVIFLRRPSVFMACIAGLASGVAVSAKYAGILLLPLSLTVVLWPSASSGAGRRWARLLAFMGVYIAILLGVNLQLLFHFGDFVGGLTYETSHAFSEHHLLRVRPFGSYYPRIIWNETVLPVLILFSAHLVLTVSCWRRRPTGERIIVLFPTGWLIVMSALTVQLGRYILPAIVLMHFIAGMALVQLIRIICDRSYVGYAAIAVLLAVLLVPLFLRCLNYLGQFADDSRVRLADWISVHGPEEGLIAQDWYVALPAEVEVIRDETRYHVPVRSKMFVGDLNKLRKARKTGYTHVAVCDLSYSRFFDRDVYPADTANARHIYSVRRGFYRQLFEEGQLLWERVPPRRMEGFTNPEIRFYRLPDIEPGPVSQSPD
jgi:hypothetical protein